MAEDGSGSLRRFRELSGSVRVRTTAAAAVVVSVALVIAAVTMVTLLRRSLTSGERTSALLLAEAVADRLAPGNGTNGIRVGEDEEFVQVLDGSGRVVASSANVAGRPPIVRLEPGEVRQVEHVPFEDDPFLTVAMSATTARGPRTVIAGRTLETVIESSRTVAGLLPVGVPLLLVVVILVTWRVVGRALAPVEAMRAEAEAISTTELHRRLPRPRERDEIARLGATLNRMLARLEKGQARQRRFVSDASHELRSPVTTIRQRAEVALAHPNGTSLEELAEVVLEEDIRLQRLVEDMLLLTKADEGVLQLRREPVDLDDLVFENAERIRATSSLRVDTGGVSAGRLSGDKAQLDRLVGNLTDNAARHAAGVVALALQEDEDVVLAVDDDGDGVPPSQNERIFERFVRLDEARDRDSGGSGLGLAIVAEVAAAHGAKVTVLKSPLGGARFEVRFPLPAG